MNNPHFPLLDEIYHPADLRQLSEDALPALSEELRRYVVQSVANTGGHLGASLGTIELTIALHYVYDTPQDKLVWDVCLLYTSPSPRDGLLSRMPSSA